MKITISVFWGLAVFIAIVDLLGFWVWKREREEYSGKLYWWLGVVLLGAVPVLEMFIYLFFSLQIRSADVSQFYLWFMVVNIVFAMIYVPKVFFLFYYFVFLLSSRIIQTVKNKRYSKEQTTIRYPKISRNKFLSQLGIIFATAPFVSLLFGMHKGRFNFFTRHQHLNFPNLPSAFDGFKVIQISDIHLGSFASNYHKLEGIVDLINNERADVIFFTGDLVNNFYEETLGWEKVFGQLKAKYGKFSILGNHDYGDYSDWDNPKEKEKNFEGIISAHEKFGFRLLRDQSLALNIEGEEIVVTGVENWGHDPFPRYGDLKKAMKGTENYPFKVLLSHDPDHWDAEVIDQTDFDLMLAGHTHGMQFGIDWKGFKWSPAKYKFKRWDGLYQHKKQYLYVNRGLGFLGMPARIGMPPEITVIHLGKGANSSEPM
ncbi:metallophosphoesterase [Saccharicrinis fermentans]|uniref:Putative metallophosphoesterase n=1 Tax=Saccharicrinis fermentans DSM 9555 = JCM 21142 TaxID=869213 RepID=W7YES2_9BACT|nr:metallophosphoesterase [Saccharicrinis fermentans]GAF02946.1 putative metallophosphoesterase [Saccharicrinis fermentans DSM 9555 = JCM 21142]